jgi:hypothetical protein
MMFGSGSGRLRRTCLLTLYTPHSMARIARRASTGGLSEGPRAGACAPQGLAKRLRRGNLSVLDWDTRPRRLVGIRAGAGSIVSRHLCLPRLRAYGDLGLRHTSATGSLHLGWPLVMSPALLLPGRASPELLTTPPHIKRHTSARAESHGGSRWWTSVSQSSANSHRAVGWRTALCWAR